MNKQINVEEFSDPDSVKKYEQNPELVAAIPTLESNAQAKLLDEYYGTAYLPFSGRQSYKNVEKFDAKCAAEDERAKKAFGDNSENYKMYLSLVQRNRFKAKKAIVSASASDAAIAEERESSAKMRAESNRSIEIDGLVDAADFAQKAEAQIYSSNKNNASLSNIDTESEVSTTAVRNSTLDDETKEEVVSGIKESTVQAKAERGAKMVSDGEHVQAQADKTIAGRVDTLIDFSKRQFAIRMARNVHHVKRGMMTFEEAYADAREKTRQEVVYYLKERVARGERKNMVELMQAMKKRNQDNFNASLQEVWDSDGTGPDGTKHKKGDKQNPYGKINIFDLACCRNSDLETIEKAAYSSYHEELARQKFEAGEIAKKQNITLRQTVHDAQVYAEDCYEKRSLSEIEAQRQKYLQDVEQIYKDNPKVISNHRVVINNAFRRAQAAHNKVAASALAAKTDTDIRTMLSEMEQKTEFDVPATLIDENGKEYQQTVTMNNHKAICALISMARASGLCKGDVFTDIYKRHSTQFKRKDWVESVLNKYFQYGLKDSRMKNGDLDDRAKGSTEYILCDSDSNGDTTLANVDAGNVVRFNDAVVHGWYWPNKDAYVDGTTIRQIVHKLDDYFLKSLNPKQEEVDKLMADAVKFAVSKSDEKAFGRNVLLSLQNNLGLMFDPVADAREYGAQRRAEYERVRSANQTIGVLNSQDWANPYAGLGQQWMSTLPSPQLPLQKPKKYGILQPDYTTIRSLLPLGVRTNAKRIMQLNDDASAIESDRDLNSEVIENE